MVAAPLQCVASSIDGGLGEAKAQRWLRICALTMTFGSEAAFLADVTHGQLLGRSLDAELRVALAEAYRWTKT